ncbi:MAG: SDR family NAD(P)-dependent oxidoreductase [Myxococcota bacterium]
MPTFLVTGATQGLGRAIAAALAADPSHHVVLAVRDVARGAEVARALGPNVEVRRLDLSSLGAVRAFAAAWEGPLAGLVNNAGVQNTAALRHTDDGWEETVAVNHLAALELTMGLLPHLHGGRVIFIGSGTHHPESRLARMFGFRGGRFTSIAALARGEGDATTDPARGRDRYATSKLLSMLTGMALARAVPADRTTFHVLDPGLMPGTGLARTAPAAARLLWSTVLRWLVPLLPDASTPTRSAGAAAWMLTSPGVENGAVYSFDRLPSRRVWRGALDPALAQRALDESLAFLGRPLLGRPVLGRPLLSQSSVPGVTNQPNATT